MDYAGREKASKTLNGQNQTLIHALLTGIHFIDRNFKPPSEHDHIEFSHSRRTILREVKESLLEGGRCWEMRSRAGIWRGVLAGLSFELSGYCRQAANGMSFAERKKRRIERSAVTEPLPITGTRMMNFVL